MERKFRIIKDQKYGYRRLEPIPSNEELERFYREKYYQTHIHKKKSYPEARRILNGNENEREREIKWLTSTYHKDALRVFDNCIKDTPKRVLDIGCGTGEFLKVMQDNGWISIGIEPSHQAYIYTQKLGLTVYNISLEKFVSSKAILDREFEAIYLKNILEHVPAPEKVLRICKNLLHPRYGMICVNVPNDFNKLQMYAAKNLGKNRWWIAIPEHINYFNFESLEKLIESVGFKVVLRTTDFPMELFLLMGDDYIGNNEVGSRCHQKRMNFEMSLPDDLRRRIYVKLASLGIGRSCIVYAKAQ